MESHGFAKRTVVSFSALSLLWIAAAAFYLVCLIAAPSYHEYRAEDPNFFSEEEESLFAIPSSLSEMERLQYAVSVIVAGAVGIFSGFVLPPLSVHTASMALSEGLSELCGRMLRIQHYGK